MSAFVVQNSSQLVATRSMSWKGYGNFKRFKILVASRSKGHGWSITRTDLVACRTKLVVMSWDVMHSRRLVKHGELPTRYLRVARRYLRVATILKETSYEFLRHLTSLLRHSYEYPQHARIQKFS